MSSFSAPRRSLTASRAYAVSVDLKRYDFFVSYTSPDEDRATWIADVLRSAGYSVLIQTDDFPPGSNFVLGMQEALQSSDRLIAVLSPSYLQARYPRAEWATGFASDPEGTGRKLVPVMVERCEPGGLLGQVVQIRIHDLDEPAAKQVLLERIEAVRAGGVQAAWPAGLDVQEPDNRGARIQSQGGLVWKRLPSSPDITWRSAFENRFPNQCSGYAAVELHLVPIGDDARLQVRDLKGLEKVLPSLGRERGLFTAVGALDARSGSTSVVVTSVERDTVAGLAATRSGQRSAWMALPRDMMGAVLDEEDLTRQLVQMLEMLVDLPVPEAELIVPAAGIEPADMLSLGRIGDLPRSSAQFGHRMHEQLRPLAEDAVTFPSLRTHRDDVAAELAARLIAEHSTASGIG